MDMIDFTGMPIRNKTYDGADGSKLAVLYDGRQYMLKLPAHAKHNPRLSIHRDIPKKCGQAPCGQSSKAKISSIFSASSIEPSMVDSLTREGNIPSGPSSLDPSRKVVRNPSAFGLQKPF